MGTVHQLRPASVSVFGTARPDRPIAVQVASANAASSALLTVAEAMSVHATLGQLIRDARLDGLMGEERADADRAVAELDHDVWSSDAFVRALDRHLAELSSAGCTQIQERESNQTSEGHQCSATSEDAGHVRARVGGEHATCLPAHALKEPALTSEEAQRRFAAAEAYDLSPAEASAEPAFNFGARGIGPAVHPSVAERSGSSLAGSPSSQQLDPSQAIRSGGSEDSTSATREIETRREPASDTAGVFPCPSCGGSGLVEVQREGCAPKVNDCHACLCARLEEG